MLRAIAFLAVALSLAGCTPAVASGERVELLTGQVGCYAGGAQSFAGRLTADPDYGTRFDGKPAMWPVGYSGLRVGSEVAVLDESGRTVAITGGRYTFSQPFIEGFWKDPVVKRLGAVGLRDCGYGGILDCSSLAGVVSCGTFAALLIGVLGAFVAFWALEDRWRLFGVAISVAAGLLGVYMGIRIVWVLTLLAVSGGALLLSRRLRV